MVSPYDGSKDSGKRPRRADLGTLANDKSIPRLEDVISAGFTGSQLRIGGTLLNYCAAPLAAGRA